MALVLVTTAGDATANAYASLADAEAYALTLPLVGDWATAAEATKNAAIAQATRMMDAMEWTGYRTDPGTQALQWPRQAVYDREGYAIASNAIPAKVRDACCEFAIRLVADDRAADAGGLAPETIELGSLKIGKMHRYPVPASVYEMTREYLAGTQGAPAMVRS